MTQGPTTNDPYIAPAMDNNNALRKILYWANRTATDPMESRDTKSEQSDRLTGIPCQRRS
jgi:hypothetical protein